VVRSTWKSAFEFAVCEKPHLLGLFVAHRGDGSQLGVPPLVQEDLTDVETNISEPTVNCKCHTPTTYLPCDRGSYNGRRLLRLPLQALRA